MIVDEIESVRFQHYAMWIASPLFHAFVLLYDED